MASQTQLAEEDAIKDAILAVLRNRGSEVSLVDLLAELRNRNVTSDAAIKMMVWPLIVEGVVELTDDHKLRILQHM